MQKTAIVVNLKASKLGRLCLVVVTLLLMLAVLLHPQPWLALWLPPLVFLAWRRWQVDWGGQAPRCIEYFEGDWWLTDAEGEVHPLNPVLRWRSFSWMAFYLPWRPPGLRTWLLWPDALSAEQRRLLRATLDCS